ncbi:MAG TPA: hypothetical protein VGL56_02405 [Fimbriimonadaceae bacterium]
MLIDLILFLARGIKPEPLKDGSAPVIQVEATAKEQEAERKRANEATYNTYREHLWTLRQTNFDKADNMILTLSSALLTFSVAFLKDIVHAKDFGGLGWLVASWIFLAFAILVCFCSFYVSRKTMERQDELAYEYYIQDKDHDFRKENKWLRGTEVCNFIAAACFVVGIALTIYSVSANLAQKGSDQVSTSSNDKSGKGSSQQQPQKGGGQSNPKPSEVRKEGAIPPPPPKKK